MSGREVSGSSASDWKDGVSAPALAAYSAQDALARCAPALTFDLPDDVFAAPIFPPQGDHALNPDLTAAPVKAKPAAVLLPIVARPQGAAMLFTQRASKLRNHAGQVSFPGGRIDDGDASPMAAALREAQEEIGLEEKHVSALGYLAPYQTGTGFRIIPVVALVAPEFSLTLNPHEVSDAFEAPLSFLMREENHRRHRWERDGVIRESWAFDYEQRLIWGVTAGILRHFWERFYR